jgi:deazaflavin-dependent oxidoreductase (nitroreductase family)
MTDADAARIRAARGDWAGEHLRIYLESGGARGHIMDVREVGGHALTTHCLLRCTGRRSGTVYMKPLIYGNIAGEAVVVASKGGADQHPSWYLNVRASDTVDLQIATQAFRATWREPEGVERHEVWAAMVALFPPFAKYQRSTSRRIPLVMMKPTESIDTFGEATR